MTILFIRHGETPLNAARVMQPPDTPLSVRGSGQAAAVAQRLRDQPIVGILSSDLRRAYDTARPIAQALGLPIQTSALLHERNFGDLRGQPFDGLGFNPLEMEDAPPNGESMPVFLARVGKALDEAARMRAQLGGPIAVVSHGLVIKALLTHFVSLPPGIELPDRLGNTSVTILSEQPPHLASLIDCQTHLHGQFAEDGRSLSGG